MEKEFICDDCEAEFKIIADNQEEVTYCPFCSNIIALEEELEEEEWDDQGRESF